MKRILLGIALGVILVYFYQRTQYRETIVNGNQIIQKQLQNVSKLVVTEGYFSDIITYKDAKKYYLDWLTSEKKAVVLVNAKATISYNLKEVNFLVNEKEHIINITKIPKPEIQLFPKLKYYDIQQDYLNPFESSDYNKISQLVDKRLQSQIEDSTFKTNAKNRLLSELHSLLNKGMDKNWTIKYNTNILFL